MENSALVAPLESNNNSIIYCSHDPVKLDINLSHVSTIVKSNHIGFSSAIYHGQVYVPRGFYDQSPNSFVLRYLINNFFIHRVHSFYLRELSLYTPCNLYLVPKARSAYFDFDFFVFVYFLYLIY